MNGDETKCWICEKTHAELQHKHVYVKEPVASPTSSGNTGKELKPCPWCGEILHQIRDYDSFVCENYQKCPWTGHGMPRASWENTWAHKRITELEATVLSREAMLDKYADSEGKWFSSIRKAEKEIASLEFQLAAEKQKSAELEKINSLRVTLNYEGKITEIEKRNKELEDHNRALTGVRFSERMWPALHERLKTAEAVIANLNDSLAAVTKEKETLNDNWQKRMDEMLRHKKRWENDARGLPIDYGI